MSTNNVVMINDKEYVFESMTENAQRAYKQLLSLRNQLADLQIRADQITAAQSVFEQILEKEIDEEPSEAPLAEAAEG